MLGDVVPSADSRFRQLHRVGERGDIRATGNRHILNAVSSALIQLRTRAVFASKSSCSRSGLACNAYVERETNSANYDAYDKSGANKQPKS
jgi:hypothetical protein